MWTFMFPRLHFLILSVATLGSSVVLRADDDARNKMEANNLGAAIFEAFAAGDTDKLKVSLPEKLAFLGDAKLMGIESAGRSQLAAPVEIEGDKFTEQYAALIEKVGKDKWSELLKKCKPTLEKATADGKPLPFVKAGDYIYDLHFREAAKGKPRGLDEAILFVLRRVDGKFVVVGHFADL